MHEPLDNAEKDDDMPSGEGPKAPNQNYRAKRNRLSGAARRALEDLCFTLWEASADPNVRNALVGWKSRNL